VLFDARLVTAPKETREELEDAVAKPTIMTIEYDKAPSYSKTELYEEVVKKVLVQDETFKKHLRDADEMCVPFPLALASAVLTRSLASLERYGPDASDKVWHLLLERTTKKFISLPPLKGDDDAEATFVDASAEAEERTLAKKAEESNREKKRMKRDLDEQEVAKQRLDLPESFKFVRFHLPFQSMYSNTGPSKRTSSPSRSIASLPSSASSSTSSRMLVLCRRTRSVASSSSYVFPSTLCEPH
jgi:hypothetical protein